MSRESWNEAYRDDPEQSVPADALLDPELEDLAPGRALDLGCGTGRNSRKLARMGWLVVGVDWADEAITIAKAMAAVERINVQFEVADITAWPPPQQFDLVISTFALPGGANTALALRTAANALAPGGTLLVAEWDKLMAAVWGFDDDELLSAQQIAALLPGLRIEVAEARQLAIPFADDEAGAELSTVAFVRAVRPASGLKVV